jgi:chromosome segregation ATPase
LRLGKPENHSPRGGQVSGIYGLEKFSHLEDKIYRTLEQFKRERQEREALEKEVVSLRSEMSRASNDKERLEQQVERLLIERDAIKLKVEGMLDAIAVLDVEAAKSGSG